MIKGRLESITFGGIVTKWIIIPESFWNENEGKSDLDLYDSALAYVLQQSGYRQHLNEKFDLHLK